MLRLDSTYYVPPSHNKSRNFELTQIKNCDTKIGSEGFLFFVFCIRSNFRFRQRSKAREILKAQTGRDWRPRDVPVPNAVTHGPG